MENVQTELALSIDLMKTKELCWLQQVPLPWFTNITPIKVSQSITMQVLPSSIPNLYLLAV